MASCFVQSPMRAIAGHTSEYPTGYGEKGYQARDVLTPFLVRLECLYKIIFSNDELHIILKRRLIYGSNLNGHRFFPQYCARQRKVE